MNVSRIKALLDQAKQKLLLANNDFADPVIDAETLLASVLGKDRSYLHTWPDLELEDSLIAKFNNYIIRREAGEPVAYITGTKGFWDLEFNITKDVLIPRPETELIVQHVLDNFPKHKLRLLDLGTGSGAIALSIATHRPNWQVVAVDCCDKALKIAKNNAENLKITNIEFILSSWVTNIINQEKFDIVVSNPPYIAEKNSYLTKGDVQFEPRGALVAGVDGLCDIKKIIKNTKKILKNSGSLILEHGFDQHLEISRVLENHGYGKIGAICDFSGHIRLSTAIFL